MQQIRLRRVRSTNDEADVVRNRTVGKRSNMGIVFLLFIKALGKRRIAGMEVDIYKTFFLFYLF